jgi:hypothetical protein
MGLNGAEKEGGNVQVRTLKLARYAYSVLTLNLTLVIGTSTTNGDR